MTFKAASKNLTNENDEFKKRCDHDECLAHTLVFWFLLGHGLPKSWMLWSSAVLWFVAPIINLLYICSGTKSGTE